MLGSGQIVARMRIKFALLGGPADTRTPPDQDMPIIPRIGETVRLQDGTEWKITDIEYELGSSFIVTVVIEPR
jgi:hypothetical protein